MARQLHGAQGLAVCGKLERVVKLMLFRKEDKKLRLGIKQQFNFHFQKVYSKTSKKTLKSIFYIYQIYILK